MQPFEAAAQAFKLGKFHDAERFCRVAIQHNPSDANAFNLLGVMAGSAGKHEVAADFIRRSVAISPDVVSFRKNLATALLSLRDFAAAENALHDVPRDAAILTLLGTSLGGQGKLSEGIDMLTQALELSPNATTLHFNLAELYRRNRQDNKAVQHFRAVLKFAPKNTDALNNLSGILLDQGEFVDALRCIERMLQINPKSAQSYANLATVMRAAGELHDSVVAVRNAIRLAPEELRYRFQLANMLIAVGRLDEADEIMEDLRRVEPDRVNLKVVHAKILERKGKVDEAAAILDAMDTESRMQPENAAIHAVVLDQLGRTREALDILEQVIRDDEAVALEGIGIQFTLAQLYDSVGRYDEAFSILKLGNENRRKAFFKYEHAAETSEITDRLIATYTPDYFHGLPHSSIESEQPVFIVGMPRSGTSLVEQILASHSMIIGAGELSEMHEQVSKTYGKSGKGRTGKQPFSIVEEDPSGNFGCLLPKGWESLDAQILKSIGDGYLEKLRIVGGDASRITDKMPYNFLLVPLIKVVFPRARIIHTRRHPVDTCLSCYFQNFAGGNQYAFDLKDLGEFYAEYLRLMSHWRDALEIEMHEVNYEDLVRAPETEARGLVKFCGLSWESQCLDYHKSKRVVSTASYQQVRQPIYQKSAGRWKNYEQHLEPLITALGIGRELLDSTPAQI